MPNFSAGSASVSVVPDLRGFQTTITRELAKLSSTAKIRVETEVDRSALRNIDRDVSRVRPKVKFDIDTRHVVGALSGLGKVAGASFAALGTQAAVGGLTAVAGAAAQAAGALALLPALGAAAAAPLAALVIGGQGIADTFKAANKATATSATSATSAAAAQRNAARQIESANRQVESANRQVADAERGVAEAQKASRQAQEQLTDARAEATRNLEDLNQQLKDSALDEESAVLAVERARERLNTVTAAGSDASELDRKEADLGYRQAVQSLEDLRIRNARLADDVKAANAAGVEGSDLVVQARERVADAAGREQDAQRSLIDAQRGVTDAQRDLADATASAAEALAAAAPKASAFQTEMAELSPSAQAFVDSVRSLGPAFTGLRLDVQERLFAGLGAQVQSLGTSYLPVLTTGLSGLAAILNTGFTDTIGVLNQASSVADVTAIFDNITAGFSAATDAAGPLAQALLDITTVGSTFLPQLGAALGGVVTQFATFIADARDSGALSDFIQTGIDTLGQLGSILGNVGSIIGGVFSAGAEVGGGFLNTIETITGAIADFVNSTQGQNALQTFFSSVADAVSALAPLLSTVATTLFGTLGPALAQLATLLAPIAQVLLEALSDALTQIAPLIPTVASAFGALVSAFVPLIPVVAQLITRLLPPLLGIIEQLLPFVSELGLIVADALVTAFDALAPYLPTIVRALSDVLAAVLPLIPVLVDLALAVIVPLVARFAAFAQIAASVISAIAPLIGAILNALVPALTFLNGIVAAVWTAIGTVISTVIDSVITPVFGLLADGVAGIGDVIQFLLDNVIRPVWDLIGAAISTVWNNVIKPVFDFFRTGISGIGDAFGGLGAIVADAWDGVKDIIVGAVNGIIDFINGFLDGINFVADLVGIDLNLHINPIPTIPQGGNPTGGGTGGGRTRRLRDGGLADEGGRVSGVGRGDHIRALLEPDEIVIRRGIAVPYRNFLLALNAGQPEALQAAGGRQSRGPVRLRSGGSVADALRFARAQSGKPYIWGGVGPTGYDCSGFMSDIANTLAGTALHARRFATSAMAGGRDAGGFVRGNDGAFTIGVDPGSHTAGTLSGFNVESGSGHGPMVGGRALGADSGFQYKYYFPQAGAFRAALGDIAQAVADPILSAIRSFGGPTPFGQFATGAASKGIQSVVDFIAGVDTTQYAASGGDSGRPEPASVTAARRALEFDSGGWLPPGFSTVYNGLGRPEPLMRIDLPEQLPSGAGRGVTGFVNNGTVVTQDVPEFIRQQRIETRRMLATVALPR